jgi:hypothetical protein
MSSRSDVLEVRLAGRVSQSIHLYVNDALKAEIVCGMVATEQDLLAEAGKARAAQTGLRWLFGLLEEWRKSESKEDGHGSSPKERREAFAEGLEAGLMDEKAPHPSLPGDYMPPERKGNVTALRKGYAAFERGWQYGQAIRRACAIATSGSEVRS